MEPETRAVLRAYWEVILASWPRAYPHPRDRSARGEGLSGTALAEEWARCLQEAAAPGLDLRVFWKIGPQFRFAGCNSLFALDAGLPAESLVGSDDYDARLPWCGQAAKYRADDEAVLREGQARLDIHERQRSSAGVIWVKVSKAPIRGLNGAPRGILGAYEVLESERAV